MKGILRYQVSKDNAELKVNVCLFGVEFYYV